MVTIYRWNDLQHLSYNCQG